MLKVHNEAEREFARATLQEVMRKLEEALTLSRKLEAEKSACASEKGELCHRG
jgi:hypothetical protein